MSLFGVQFCGAVKCGQPVSARRRSVIPNCEEPTLKTQRTSRASANAPALISVFERRISDEPDPFQAHLHRRQENILSQLSAIGRHTENRLLAGLSPSILQSLESEIAIVTLDRGTVLYDPAAAITEVYFPLNGMISLLVVGSDGQSVETATVGREGAIGIHAGFGSRHSFSRAMVQVAGRFSKISAVAFRRAAEEHSPIRRLISRYTEILWAEAQQVAACNAMHDAEARLCRWLLQTADRVNMDVLPLTQEILSQMLAVQRTTITLLARQLLLEGKIAYTRGRIEIVDRAALEATACECYKVVRYDRLAKALGVSLYKSDRH